jgi:hypothetical protein
MLVGRRLLQDPTVIGAQERTLSMVAVPTYPVPKDVAWDKKEGAYVARQRLNVEGGTCEQGLRATTNILVGG